MPQLFATQRSVCIFYNSPCDILNFIHCDILISEISLSKTTYYYKFSTYIEFFTTATNQVQLVCKHQNINKTLISYLIFKE